eukprot:3240937-Amphidinium_carterae.1
MALQAQFPSPVVCPFCKAVGVAESQTTPRFLIKLSSCALQSRSILTPLASGHEHAFLPFLVLALRLALQTAAHLLTLLACILSLLLTRALCIT